MIVNTHLKDYNKTPVGASFTRVYNQTHQPCFQLEKTEGPFVSAVLQASTADCFDMF